MITRLLASAAIAGVLAIGTVSAQTTQQQAQPGSLGAGANQSPQQAAVPAKPATSQSKSMSKASMNGSSARQMKKSDNVANQLNACQLRAEGERQSCMSQISSM